VGSDLEAQYTAPREGDVRDSHADLTLASDLLGYTPHIDLDLGLGRTIASFRS
jgi:nucleoside-diphosphate-sugar epimerase